MATSPYQVVSGQRQRTLSTRPAAPRPVGRQTPYAAQAPQQPATAPQQGQVGLGYPQNPPTFFQPRQPLEGPARVRPPVTQRAEEQRRLLGPAAQLFPIASNRPLTRGDIPLLELGFNYEQLLQAERDRERGYNELTASRQSVGTDPALMRARELMGGFAEQGPFSEDIINQNVAAIRSAGGLDIQRSRQRAAEDLARRGLVGGGVPEVAFQDIELQRGAQTQQQLTDFLREAALTNREAQLLATQQLGGIGQQQELQRQAIDRLIADLFTETERAPISLAGLIPQTTKGQRKLVRQAV